MTYVLTNPLCSLADVKSALRLRDPQEDDRISLSIDAASRQIEGVLGRRFWQDAVPTARYFTAQTLTVVKVDDFATTTGLIVETLPNGVSTESVTWDPLDYQLEPLNSLLSEQSWPYDGIRAVRSFTFPVYGLGFGNAFTQALVRITARWGWDHVPAPIQKAAIVQSISLFKADDVPFGATPFGDTGVLRINKDLHPTALQLIDPYFKSGIEVW